MYYTIIKSICDDLKLSYYYGEGWLQNYESLNATYPAVFMFNIIENYIDFPNESQYRNLNISFALLKRIAPEDHLSPDSLTNDNHVKEMRSRLWKLLKRIRDYRQAGVPIFNTGDNWTIKVIENPRFQMFNDYVSGVTCEMTIKVLNLDALCS